MNQNHIAQYLLLRIKEASARLKAVATVVTQPTAKGTVGEGVLHDVIRGFLPIRCEVTSGFVVKPAGGKLRQSSQIDILIYDCDKSSPLYRDKNLAVVTADMPRLAIESKMVMNKSQLVEAISGVKSVKSFGANITGIVWAYHGMKLDTLKGHLSVLLKKIPHDKWPDHIFNFDRGYVVSRMTKQAPSANWIAFHGQDYVVRLLFQAILYGANVKNLMPFITKIKPTKTEKF